MNEHAGMILILLEFAAMIVTLIMLYVKTE